MSRPCLSSSVIVRPLRPTKDHRLGKLLSHQLPNPVKAHFMAKKSLNYKVFNQTIKQIPLRYSPVRHFKFVRLACIKQIDSVHSEPGSNSLV